MEDAQAEGTFAYPRPAIFAGAILGNISLNPLEELAISSGKPTDTRRCVVIGGNGRPTSTPFLRNSSIAGAGRLVRVAEIEQADRLYFAIFFGSVLGTN